MRLRSKILILVAAALALTITLNFLVFRWVVQERFQELELAETEKNLDRCIFALDREVHHLESLVHDWASWDDTYQFIVDQNSKYIEATLVVETFRNNRLSLIGYYDKDGNLVWGRTLAPDESKLLDENPLATVLMGKSGTMLTSDDSFSGIVMTKRGPMLIAALPILTSENKGPSRGTLIMGRLFDERLLFSVSQQVNVDLDFMLVRDHPSQFEKIFPEGLESGTYAFEVVGSDQLNGYAVVRGLLGQPVFVFRAHFNRDIYHQGISAIEFGVLSSLIVGLIALLIFALLLNRFIVSPISDLAGKIQAVSNATDLNIDIPSRRSDEIGMLARDFKRMIGRLGKAQQALAAQSYHAGQTEAAVGALHNIGNAVNPIRVRGELILGDLERTGDSVNKAVEELRSNTIDSPRTKKLLEYLEQHHSHQKAVMDKTADYLRFIEGQVNHIHKLLEHQRVQSKSGIILEPINLDSVLKEAQSRIDNFRLHNVDFQIDSSFSEAGPVLAEWMRLVLVFENLIINSLDSMERENSFNKILKISANESHNGTIEISFSDNGQGIEAENLSRIFQKGYTTKSSTEHGIGLHWCSIVLAEMGGGIEARSPGQAKGATFAVTLRKAEDAGA